MTMTGWQRWVVLAAIVCAAASGMGAEAAPAAGQTTVLNTGSYWRMFLTHRRTVVRGEDGQLTEKRFFPQTSHGARTPLPPADWAAPDFDDSLWIRRQGPLFRLTDKHREHAYPGMALICLRGRFEVVDPERVGDLTLSVAYRGGVVAYVNGKEVARGHLPDAEKKGLEAVAEDYPDEVFRTADGKPLLEEHRKDPQNAARFQKRERSLSVKIPASVLRKGTNVLALEIHRAPVPRDMNKCLGPHHILSFLPIGLVSAELKASGDGIVPSIARPRGVQLWAHSPSERLYERDYDTLSDPGTKVVRVFGARNGAFPAYVAVGSTETIKGLKAVPSDLKGPGVIPAKAVQVRYALADGQAGGLKMYDNDAQGCKAFDALDPAAPAEVPVPAKPNGVTQSGDGVTQPIWLTVHVPKDAIPGDYSGSLTVTVEGADPMQIPLRLSVADWVLPDPKDFQTEVGFHQSWESVAMQYKVELWSEKHWQLLDKVFELMGLAGNDHVYIYLIRMSHAGNSQSMVRWIKKDDGTFDHDFSIVEKYLDLAIKHLGKPGVICAIAWDQCHGASDKMPSYLKELVKPKFPPRITVLDPKTGKVEDGVAPHFGTPESRKFWKPVYDGLLKIVKDRGLDPATLMHGVHGDVAPSAAAWDDLAAVLPAKWVFQNHGGASWDVRGGKQRWEYIGSESLVYVGTSRDPDDEEHYKGKRVYGWRQDEREGGTGGQGKSWRRSIFCRWVFHNSCPAHRRILLEACLAGAGQIGIARTGFDFWPVIPDARHGFGSGTLCNRYPENNLGQTSICAGDFAWIAPGKDGPLSTIRLESFRAGAQECEARIFIEKALVDPAQRARLGEELARRAQQLLDERQRLIAIVERDESFWSFNSWWWEESTGRLYKLAAEVAEKVR